MSESHQFRLPDVGEGLTEAEVVTWHVAVGDEVEVNDVLVDIETAKSVVELPSPFRGVVELLLVAPGETVPVGSPLIVIGARTASAEPAASLEVATAGATFQQQATDEEDKPQVLVGPGPKEAATRQRRLTGGRPLTPSPTASAANPVRTTPPVRLRAKTLGVDLEALAPHTGVVTLQDVERAADVGVADPRERRVPVKGVRKATADAMVRSAFTAPHVTEWLTVDMTRSMELVRRLKAARDWKGVRVTPLLVVARAFLLAIRSFPDVSATWDQAAGEIVYKDYVNLGIAAATPRGLLVPNIKDAHTLDLAGLAAALEQLIETARAGRTQPAELARGTVTITNIGAFGIDAGTPILNPGESAILAFGVVREQPWVVDGQVVVREVTQLAMSFDHRLVDGELGSRVLARTGEILTDPGSALLYL
jgi:2-oxoisovalerate dehydrogenase E2 component (dihydrolipoyl transacylase)